MTSSRPKSVPDQDDPMVSLIAFSKNPVFGDAAEDLGRGMFRLTLGRSQVASVGDDLDSMGIRWSEE